MSIEIQKAAIPDILIVRPRTFADQRGFFLETYHRRKYADAGLDVSFVQDNHSHSCKGTLRGLHYQLRHPQGKLVFAATGEIYDVAVDIRKTSPTFGKWFGIKLGGKENLQVYVPPGFAHGFCVLSETADVIYKCTDFYAPDDEQGVLWSDPDLAISWPVQSPLLSPKDEAYPVLSQIASALLPG